MLIESAKAFLFWNKIRFGKPQLALYYRQVLENQRLSRDELDELNWQKRKSILSHAFEHVPFYRRKYEQAGLCPNDIKSPDDFARIPIVEKDEIRAHAQEMLSDEAEARFMVESSTGGSTGVPVKVMHDTRFHYEPLLWRMLGWWGVSPEMNSAYVLRLRRKRIVERWANAAMWWPTMRVQMDASLMTEHDMRRFIGRLHSIRPKLLQGYVGSVYHLALFMEKHGLTIQPPKAIWVTSSPISIVQRLKIEKVFGAPVYDQYGCGEIYALAAQCRVREGLHVFWDARFIEFVDHNAIPVNDGEYGTVLVTDLENRVFPLIRYKNGDIGRFLGKQCPCGCELPLIDSVKGRITDCLTLPDGSKVSGDYLTTIFDDFPETVQAFQIRQGHDFSVRLLYVPSPGEHRTDQAICFVKGELEKRCRGQATVLIQKVEAIPHDRGKLRFVISEVE
jgi:phenylacetate-CoA ligase